MNVQTTLNITWNKKLLNVSKDLKCLEYQYPNNRI